MDQSRQPQPNLLLGRMQESATLIFMIRATKQLENCSSTVSCRRAAFAAEHSEYLLGHRAHAVTSVQADQETQQQTLQVLTLQVCCWNSLAAKNKTHPHTQTCSINVTCEVKLDCNSFCSTPTPANNRVQRWHAGTQHLGTQTLDGKIHHSHPSLP